MLGWPNAADPPDRGEGPSAPNKPGAEGHTPQWPCRLAPACTLVTGASAKLTAEPRRCDIVVVVSGCAGGGSGDGGAGRGSGDAFDDGGVGHAAGLAHGLQAVLNTF